MSDRSLAWKSLVIIVALFLANTAAAARGGIRARQAGKPGKNA